VATSLLQRCAAAGAHPPCLVSKDWASAVLSRKLLQCLRCCSAARRPVCTRLLHLQGLCSACEHIAMLLEMLQGGVMRRCSSEGRSIVGFPSTPSSW
jgi:hypothetical protein